jgi:predicted nucleotidyltransferase
MVYQETELRALIRQFVKEAQKKIKIEKIILFGSYARGKPHLGSDIDLAVISRDFKKIDDIKRIGLLLEAVYKLKMPKLVDVEPLGFTEEELNNADYFDIAAEIKEKGKVVYKAKDRDA